MDKLYLVFTFAHYYPCGGADDLMGVFQSQWEAESAVEKAAQCEGPPPTHYGYNILELDPESRASVIVASGSLDGAVKSS